MTRLEEIKKRKPFALWDLLIYGMLVAVILILFGVFVFGGRGKAASGVQIALLGNDETVIYSYEYGSEKRTVAEGWEARISEKVENGVLLVTVYMDDEKKDYNTVAIDLEKKTSKMRDANCSFRKDCVHSSGIESEKDFIVCLPHKLKVCALGGAEEDFSKPSVG